MRLLLDESVPRRLETAFPAAYEVRTVPQMGWAVPATANCSALRRTANSMRWGPSIAGSRTSRT